MGDPSTLLTTVSTGHVKLLPQTTEFRPLINSVSKTFSLNFIGSLNTLRTSRLSQLSKDVTSSVTVVDGVEEPAEAIRSQFSDFLECAYMDEKNAKEACCFTIRVTRAAENKHFNFPRWHRDGRMYDSADGGDVVRSGYNVSLLGPSTAFANVPHTDEISQYTTWVSRDDPRYLEDDWTISQRWDFDDDVSRDEQVARRGKVDSWVKRISLECFSPAQGQVSRFSWGLPWSPIHSEPDMRHSDRVYASVQFGSEADLRSMSEIRETSYEE